MGQPMPFWKVTPFLPSSPRLLCRRPSADAGPHQGEDRAERKIRREEFLFKRSLPAPQNSAVLHGPHTRLGEDSTHRRWWHVDCEGKVMGRIAAEIVRVVQGKHKPIYDPSSLSGDYVVVTNVEKMGITGEWHAVSQAPFLSPSSLSLALHHAHHEG